MNIAVILFAFDRPKYLRETLKTLHTELDKFAFVDYSDKQSEIEGMLHRFQIVKREFHFGLAANIISGVTEIFKRGYDSVIVVEDDLVLFDGFFEYMKKNLELYRNVKEIGSVSGYNNKLGDKRASSLGWGTWADRWEIVDWNYHKLVKKEIKEFSAIGTDLPGMYKKAMNGKIDSWAIRFAYWHYKRKMICVKPKISLLKHIGTEGTNVKWYCKFGIRQYLRRFIREDKSFGRIGRYRVYTDRARWYANYLQMLLTISTFFIVSGIKMLWWYYPLLFAIIVISFVVVGYVEVGSGILEAEQKKYAEQNPVLMEILKLLKDINEKNS